MGRPFSNRFNYVTVAASQTTAQICSQNGFIKSITVIKPSSTPGGVTLLDGSTNIMVIPTEAGGDTRPYTVELNIYSKASGGFKITTGSCVSVIVSGNAEPRDDE